MDRRRFLQTTIASSLGSLALPHTSLLAPDAGPKGGAAYARGFDTVGLYVSLPTDPPPASPKYYDFFRACGYNYLEFCEAGFRMRPDLLPEYYAMMARAIALAHEKGFRVGIVLLAGMEQWRGPADRGFQGAFSPLDRARLQERLDYIAGAVRALRGADAFIFLPGDPGGDPQGRSTVADCVDFCRAVEQIVERDASGTTFMLNLWAIAEWQGFPSPFTLRFWQQEVALSRAATTSPGLLGRGRGVAFPLHNYYRSLSLALYERARATPESYPSAADIRRLRARGVGPLLGWPYFLVDEADEGFLRPNNVTARGQSSAETRYIRALIEDAGRLRLDGLVANAIFFEAEALNIFAFGQMCRSFDLTAEQVIDRYAGFLASDRTRPTLSRVMRYIENHSNWQVSLPVAARLRNFDVPEISSPAEALELLARVEPHERPGIPLLEPPGSYLARLTKRLEAIAAGQVGGVAQLEQRESR
jgi:hypothetical protein